MLALAPDPNKPETTKMAFIVATKKTFTAPVKATLPDDGGRTRTVTFSVIFKALTQPEVEDMYVRINARTKANKAALEEGRERVVRSDRELLNEVLVGFGEDIKEEDGTPMVFNPVNMERLCDTWGIEAAIVKSFFDHYINAATKN